MGECMPRTWLKPSGNPPDQCSAGRGGLKIQDRLPFHQPSAGRAGDHRVLTGRILKDMAANRADHLVPGPGPLAAALPPHAHRPDQRQSSQHGSEVQDDQVGKTGADHSLFLAGISMRSKATPDFQGTAFTFSTWSTGPTDWITASARGARTFSVRAAVMAISAAPSGPWKRVLIWRVS